MSHPPLRDIAGQHFSKLVVVEFAGYRQRGAGRRATWKCRCDCGNEVTVESSRLLRGVTKSCGCLVGKHTRTHGGTDTPEFRAWQAMKDRCRNPKSKMYKDYGARGIRVCDRWVESFANFLADVGPRPSADHSIDRYPNNDGNYEPGNCRWATMLEQDNNKRNNVMLTLNGETRTLAQWARHVGLSSSTIQNRIRDGWTLGKALSVRPWANGKQHSRAKVRE